MERKIGEIFEYNGEWYQCVKASSCKECDLYRFHNCNLQNPCSKLSRKDGNEVAFKKLEKIGKPKVINGKMVQKLVKPEADGCVGCCFWDGEGCIIEGEGRIIEYDVYSSKGTIEYEGCYTKEIYVEIKQDKEDMEKGKLDSHMEKVIDEATQKLGDEISRQLNENLNKQRMKPFDLELAKQGKPVCTRDGRKARIICFDAKGDKPIIALIEAKGNHDALIEKVEKYFINGHSVFEVRETDNDLMMLPEKKEGWINLYKYRTPIYETESKAASCVGSEVRNEYLGTVKVEWEDN